MTWALFRLALSQIGAFIIKHWRVIVPVLLLWYCYNLYSNAVAARAVAERELASQIQLHEQFKTDIALKTEKRRAENACKQALAKKSLEESEKQHKAVVAKLNLDREREKTNIRALYEKRLNDTKHNFIERVRLEAERYRLGVSDTASDTERLTKTERECYAGYSTLERACQVTTIDYNRLRGWADAACEQVGCK